ncbi:hypothetical protein D557_0095 [Bordetella holmesii 70147]|nr:hypothetical protein D558_0852 [Bordetella holmesii 44057]EWM50252.1 hypothetical protein D557_0095 [Bordetella holmesii 70147]
MPAPAAESIPRCLAGLADSRYTIDAGVPAHRAGSTCLRAACGRDRHAIHGQGG